MVLRFVQKELDKGMNSVKGLGLFEIVSSPVYDNSFSKVIIMILIRNTI